VVSTQDATGARVCEARMDDNSPAAFAAYFARLSEPSRVVVEACWNWGWLYDELGEIDCVEDVVLAHPFKTRLIADAQIKTNKLDARRLATLLRGKLLATVHAPDPANRSRKHVIRQRLFLARVRTMLRNRVHTLVARQRNLARPVFSDQFGKKGLHWLRTLRCLSRTPLCSSRISPLLSNSAPSSRSSKRRLVPPTPPPPPPGSNPCPASARSSRR
jgi:transposase